MSKKEAVIIKKGSARSRRKFSRMILSKDFGVNLEKVAIEHDGPTYRVVVKEHLRNVEVTGLRPGLNYEIHSHVSSNKLDEKIERLEKRYISLLSDMEESLNQLSEDYESFKREIYSERFLKQQGAEILELYKIIPIRAYLASDESTKLLEESIKEYIEELEGEVVEDYQPINGSWFKEWFAKIYSGKSKEQIDSDLKKTRKAIELKTISLPQSEVDSNNSDAISKLVLSIKDQKYAVIQVGALLIVKYQNNNKPIVVSKVLNVNELIYLENNQQLLSNPDNILLILSENTSNTSQLQQIK